MKIKNSNRLSYALMDAGDADLLFELDQDPKVMRYINGGKITSRKDLNEVSIPRMESYRNDKQGWGLWKVLILESGLFIGWILVRPMHFFSEQVERDNLELGWRFKQAAWGNGFATEAAESFKDAIILAGKAKKITAIAFEANVASTNIMVKLGLKYSKTGIHKDPLGDQEVVYYELQI